MYGLVCGGENTIIGPFFCDGTLTSERYLNLIRNDVLDALDNQPLAVLQEIWWQQDGATAYNGREVTQFLNHVFPNKWIGNNGFMRWPAREYRKNRLYKNTPHALQVLRQWFGNGFNLVSNFSRIHA